MNDMHDAWFFVGIFVFIFLLWIVTGGPLHPIAFTGPKLAAPGVLGGGTYLSLPQAPFSIGGTNVSLPGSSSGGGTVDAESSLPILTGSKFGAPSLYRSIIRMNHSVFGVGSTDPAREYLEISVAQNAGLPINLSEWSLRSDATGNSVNIPKGTEVPLSGVINAKENIVLMPGDRAVVISGQSPIGASFRENKCIGYFSTFQTFRPSLPQNCPLPSNELSSFYGASYIRDTACIEAVDKISRCQVTLSPPANVSNACQDFMVKYLNYNGCVEAHRKDADFLGTTWRIYLGRTNPMWRSKYEVVKLLDVNGKTVDAFSY